MNPEIIHNQTLQQPIQDYETTVTLDEMTEHVLEYLQTQATTGGTLEDIARWWLMERQLDSTLEQVQEALQQLRTQEKIVEFGTPKPRPTVKLGPVKENHNIEPVSLNPVQKSRAAQDFEKHLAASIIGQEDAVRHISGLYQSFLSGMTPINRPVGTMLLLGPTGTGKTRVVEGTAEALFGDRQAMIKIDCAEFQHAHEIGKLIGSPPGYVGYGEVTPILSQENLDRWHTEETKLSIVLFDEIEKASDALWQLLLGILDKATLTLGDNRRVDFSRSIVIMTSNLGAREMSEMIAPRMGFVSAKDGENPEGATTAQMKTDQKMYQTAVNAARRAFSPEFMNRIDKTVVFRSLEENHLRQILDLELEALQRRIIDTSDTKFIFQCAEAAKEKILKEGLDLRYGARHLRRSIERSLVFPLSNLIASQQIGLGDLVSVDLEPERGELAFTKYPGAALSGDAPDDSRDSSEEVYVSENAGRSATRTAGGVQSAGARRYACASM